MSKASTPTRESAVKNTIEVKEPPRYKVLLLNDDYTTMDFVVAILVKVFRKTPEQAVQIMLNVHRRGMGVAGVYVKEIAEAKCVAVHQLAESHGFPLRCVTEPE